jgi:hypothetical protein
MSKPSMAGMDSHYRTLYRPAAEESYKEAFARVPLNIHVLFGNYDDLPRDYRVREMHRDKADVFLVIPTDVRPGVFSAKKPGDPERIAPFTPFVLLHRLGDNVRDGRLFYDEENDEAEYADGNSDPFLSGHQLTRVSRYLNEAYGYQPSLDPQYYSRGVNAGVGTAAGRLNALDSVNETWSDLFAKYLLTQRFDFDPEAGTFPKEIRELRREWAVIAYEHMKNVLARLQERGAFLYLSV